MPILAVTPETVQLATAVFTFLGALVGAICTLLGAWIARGQKRIAAYLNGEKLALLERLAVSAKAAANYSKGTPMEATYASLSRRADEELQQHLLGQQAASAAGH